MKALDIQTRKLLLIEDISRMKPMTSAELKSRIDASEAAIKEGNIISQEDLEREAENW